MKTLQELKKKELIELVVSLRPYAEAYKRILSDFGIERDLIGFIGADKIAMLEWIARQGYRVDRATDSEVYWMKYHGGSQQYPPAAISVGTTKDIVQKYETYKRLHKA